MRKIIIHNHLPKARDEEARATIRPIHSNGGWRFRLDGKNYGPYPEEAEAKAAMNKLRGNDARDADINYSIVMKGYMLRHGGSTYGPFKSEGEAEAKKKSLSPGGGHDAGNVRMANEKDAGITRIGKDGGPGSGPQGEGGGSSKEKFVEKKNLNPNSKKKEGITFFAKKPPDNRTMWQKLRYGGNDEADIATYRANDRRRKAK